MSQSAFSKAATADADFAVDPALVLTGSNLLEPGERRYPPEPEVY